MEKLAEKQIDITFELEKIINLFYGEGSGIEKQMDIREVLIDVYMTGYNNGLIEGSKVAKDVFFKKTK
jgi:hypothetical protein